MTERDSNNDSRRLAHDCDPEFACNVEIEGRERLRIDWRRFIRSSSASSLAELIERLADDDDDDDDDDVDRRAVPSCD
jgi:hypothetical protein